MKNLLATVGLVVIAKAGYEFYSRFRDLERENAFWRQAAAQAKDISQT
jgi:hypothetical protein